MSRKALMPHIKGQLTFLVSDTCIILTWLRLHRIMLVFNDFLVEESIIQLGTNIFNCAEAWPKHWLLHCWVYHETVYLSIQSVSSLSDLTRCDDIDMHGISRGPNNAQKSYLNAMKLRAGTTYGFRKTGHQGKVPWSRVTALENPSISDLVSLYMLGLHKCKVCFETRW